MFLALLPEVSLPQLLAGTVIEGRRNTQLSESSLLATSGELRHIVRERNVLNVSISHGVVVFGITL